MSRFKSNLLPQNASSTNPIHSAAEYVTVTIREQETSSVAVGRILGSSGGVQLVVQTTEAQKIVNIPSIVVGQLESLESADTAWAVPLDNDVGLAGGYVAARFNGEIDIGVTRLPNREFAIQTIKGHFVARELADQTGVPRPSVLVTDLIDRKADTFILNPLHPSRESQLHHQDNVLRLPRGETLRIYCLHQRNRKVRFALYGDLVLYLSGEIPFLRSYEVDVDYLARFPETVAGTIQMGFWAAADYVALLYQAHGRRILDHTIAPVFLLPRADLTPGDQPYISESERLAAAERLVPDAMYRWGTQEGAMAGRPDYLTSSSSYQAAIAAFSDN
jgi:hypothetical protein